MTEVLYHLFCNDKKRRAAIDPHSNGPLARRIWRTPKQMNIKGHPFVKLRGGYYSLEGRVIRYEYRLARNLWHVKYEGREMYWREGHPEPIDPYDPMLRSDLDGMAQTLEEIVETDAPDRLLQPPRLPWSMILLVGMVFLFIGFAVGQYIGGH